MHIVWIVKHVDFITFLKILKKTDSSFEKIEIGAAEKNDFFFLLLFSEIY